MSYTKPFSREEKKPRRGVRPPARSKTGGYRFRAAARLKAERTRENFEETGVFLTTDRRPSGGASGLVVGVTGMAGGVLTSPAFEYAKRLRARLRPIDIAPTTVTDASGTPIATITVDPVTGKRTRTAIRSMSDESNA